MTLGKLLLFVLLPVLLIGAVFFGVIMWRRSKHGATTPAAPAKPTATPMAAAPAKPAAAKGGAADALKTAAADPKVIAAATGILSAGAAAFSEWWNSPPSWEDLGLEG